MKGLDHPTLLVCGIVGLFISLTEPKPDLKGFAIVLIVFGCILWIIRKLNKS